ncbi:MAG: hypothetical protein KBD29_02690 [Candidatus Magasanikbacteria bacterium]|nr:hypothetical protein [Candidatus Magasanikbacteria bacterium]
MSFTLLITFEGFKNKGESIAELRRGIVNLEGILCHNPLNSKDGCRYKVEIADPKYYDQKEADISARVTQESNTDVETLKEPGRDTFSTGKDDEVKAPTVRRGRAKELGFTDS